jgi:hypothetical protein
MGKESRTDISIMQIKLAFLGATLNLHLLENVLMQIENIPMYQYSNYLSQVAFCIELGLKSIVINTDDFEHTHDIETLFLMTPPVFQKKFRTLYSDDETFNSNMSGTKNIFKNFRYMELKSNLKEYLDENIINNDMAINLKLAINLPNIQFLQKLLDEISEYEKFLHEEDMKRMSNIDCSDIDFFIKQHTESLKDIQSNIVLMPK